MANKTTLSIVSEQKSAGGRYLRVSHYSTVLNCEMTFGVFLPPQCEQQPCPSVWFLSGLTCTDQNVMQKSGAHRVAAELGLVLIAPDTSPRGTQTPGEDDDIAYGSGAGFYLNATRTPWAAHYRMFDYVTDELPALVAAHFPVNGAMSITGHSMGGHGAMVCALRLPEKYASVSAFAPIAAPSHGQWGQTAFSHYLGEDRAAWADYDSTELVLRAADQGKARLPLLIDQGEADEFLQNDLMPERLEQACHVTGYPLTLRRHAGYDHSYYFIASFIEDHLRYHARALGVADA